MDVRLPLCARPAAFRFLADQLIAMESPDALLNGAVAVAMHQMPDADPTKIDATIQSYADAVRARVKGRQPQALLAHLHDYLFEELGFSGNVEDYYNPRNSCLPAVLETKSGLPITL